MELTIKNRFRYLPTTFVTISGGAVDLEFGTFWCYKGPSGARIIVKTFHAIFEIHNLNFTSHTNKQLQ